MKRAITFLAMVATVLAPASAQVNGKGKVQVGAGILLGAHATHFENEFHFAGITTRDKSDDGAVTFTFPIEAQVGLMDRFSLGLYVEPGRYIDSAGTHPNHLFLLGVAPRFYLVNKDHFGLSLEAELGLNYLRIAEVEDDGLLFDDHYSGGHFGLGLGLQWYFGNHFGIGLGLNYIAARFNWRDRGPDDPLLDVLDYSARLNTSGVQFRTGLRWKF